MNIHFYKNERISTEEARKLRLIGKSRRNDGAAPKSQPPRTRFGKTYPGGRVMRRALKRLHDRVEGQYPGGHKRPDRINDQSPTTPWGKYGLNRPGSMTR